MARTLQPDSRIAHYRIVGPLGAGGMGEVYLARDEKLERNVALKILPPELVRSEDRVRRFMLEARSASSLNHPNIVTIYEVGHEVARDGDGVEGATAGGEAVHYIAMELVTGKTLKDLIHAERTDLRTLLGYLAQAAEGLAKAHAAGIVHRDLKPGNVMVTADGYAKVLDFGLAKLTERGGGEPDATAAPTATGDLTGGGMVLGTVGYMAPEQVRGKGIDHRADVFSFGCMLYEAATRQRPFAADSNIDTMHRILHDQPAAIDEIDPTVPAEVRRLVRRCLAKNPEQRVQSIKDLAIELREVADEYDKLSASATSGSVALPAAVAARRSPVLVAAFAAAAAIGLAGIAFGVWSLMSRGEASAASRPFESVRLSSVLSHPDLRSATLSRDGRYLAYVTLKDGRTSLRVRQVATGSDVEVLAPRQEGVRGVGFSPDGDYILFLQRDPETPNYSALFEVASLGGTPRKRLFDVDSGVTFSPDGRRVAFLRGVPQEDRTALIAADLDTGAEKVVASIAEPELAQIGVVPAWSPDGARIVVAVQDNRTGIRAAPVAFEVDGGGRQSIGSRPLLFINSLAWLADGSGLVVAANTLDAISMQPYFVAWPSGQTRRITTDLDTYVGVSVADDGALATLRTTGTGDLWVAPIAAPEKALQITRGGSNSMGNLQPLDDGTILVSDTVDDRRRLVTLRPDGSDRRAITGGAGHAIDPVPIPGGRGIVFTLVGEDDGVLHLYRVDADGGNLTQLTSGQGETAPMVLPDGQAVLFQRPDQPNVVWRVSLGGGEPTRFLDEAAGMPSISADGRVMAYAVLREIEGRQRPYAIVVPLAGGDPIFEGQPPARAALQAMSADGTGMYYVDKSQPAENVWFFPFGGSPRQLTRFSEGTIRSYAWSKDRKHLLVCRNVGQADNLWVTDADGANARKITDFRSGFINQTAFLADQQQVAFVQGEARRDVVLIRETERDAGS